MGTANYLYDNHDIITKNCSCGADLYVEKLTQGSPYTGVVRVRWQFILERLAQALEKYYTNSSSVGKATALRQK